MMEFHKVCCQLLIPTQAVIDNLMCEFLKIDKKLLFLCLSIGRKMTKVKNMQLINHSKK